MIPALPCLSMLCHASGCGFAKLMSPCPAGLRGDGSKRGDRADPIGVAACERGANVCRHPDAVISLGVAQSRQKINLERIAVNVDDASIADNAGHLASGEMIAPDGPVAYWSTLPIEAMQTVLEARDIPVAISNGGDVPPGRTAEALSHHHDGLIVAEAPKHVSVVDGRR